MWYKEKEKEKEEEKVEEKELTQFKLLTTSASIRKGGVTYRSATRE